MAGDTNQLATLMMEAARASETSVDTYFTWKYIPEDKSELHTHCRENLKSQTLRKFNCRTSFLEIG
jgi:hypothetical protein